MSAYLIHITILTLITIIASFSFNLSVGYTGMVNFGIAGLLGVGAYASAILGRSFDWPFWASVLVAAILTMIVSGLLAIPARKIKGDYYALVTLGFMFVAQAIYINWESLTRGTLGISGIPRPEGFASNQDFLVITVIVTGIIFLFLWQFLRSPFGRALEAVRDDEEVAEALGKPIFKLKMISMLISGFILGIAGAFLAHFIQFISPGTFWLDWLIFPLAAVIVGGLASMRGTVLGVIIIMFIVESLRFAPIPDALVGPLRIIVYMVLLLLIIIYRPKGIMGRAQLEN